jgi:hypothetical protein
MTGLEESYTANDFSFFSYSAGIPPFRPRLPVLRCHRFD